MYSTLAWDLSSGDPTGTYAGIFVDADGTGTFTDVSITAAGFDPAGMMLYGASDLTAVDIQGTDGAPISTGAYIHCACVVSASQVNIHNAAILGLLIERGTVDIRDSFIDIGSNENAHGIRIGNQGNTMYTLELDAHRHVGGRPDDCANPA